MKAIELKKVSLSDMQNVRTLCEDIECCSQVMSVIEQIKEANSDAIIAETKIYYSIFFSWIFEI